MTKNETNNLSQLELFRRFLLANIDHEEKLKLEIYALRKTLEVYANPKPSADVPLEKIVEEMMADPIVQSLVRREFDEARSQVEQLIQDGQFLQLLHRYSPKGPPN